jgi:hypothetical protein
MFEGDEIATLGKLLESFEVSVISNNVVCYLGARIFWTVSEEE